MRKSSRIHVCHEEEDTRKSSVLTHHNVWLMCVEYDNASAHVCCDNTPFTCQHPKRSRIHLCHVL